MLYPIIIPIGKAIWSKDIINVFLFWMPNWSIHIGKYINPKLVQNPFIIFAINKIITLSVIVKQKIEKQLIKKEIINKFFLLKKLKININNIVPKILPKWLKLPNKPNFVSSIWRVSLIIVEAEVNKPVSIDIIILINK